MGRRRAIMTSRIEAGGGIGSADVVVMVAVVAGKGSGVVVIAFYLTEEDA